MPKNSIKNFIEYRKDVDKHFCDTFGLNYKVYMAITLIMQFISIVYMIFWYIQLHNIFKERKVSNAQYNYTKDEADDEQIFEE